MGGDQIGKILNFKFVKGLRHCALKQRIYFLVTPHRPVTVSCLIFLEASAAALEPVLVETITPQVEQTQTLSFTSKRTWDSGDVRMLAAEPRIVNSIRTQN